MAGCDMNTPYSNLAAANAGVINGISFKENGACEGRRATALERLGNLNGDLGCALVGARKILEKLKRKQESPCKDDGEKDRAEKETLDEGLCRAAGTVGNLLSIITEINEFL